MENAIKIIRESIILIALIYISYRFYASYRTTKNNLFEALFIIFTGLSLVFLPYFIFAVLLGFPFDFEDEFIDSLLLISIVSVAWVVLPRRGWKSRLRYEDEKESKRGNKVA